jgi:quinol monooxygenase YgiN
MIYVLATMTAVPGKAAELIKGARAAIDATRKEDGCISYDYVQDTENPDILTVVERWTSRAALEAHLQMPHLATWRAARKGLVAQTKVEIIHADKVETI